MILPYMQTAQSSQNSPTHYQGPGPMNAIYPGGLFDNRRQTLESRDAGMDSMDINREFNYS